MPANVGSANQFRVSSAGAVVISGGVLAYTAGEGWAFDDTPGAVADGYLVYNDGPAADDAATSGGRVWRRGPRIIGTY